MAPTTEEQPAAINGGLLTRNWLLNLVGWGVPIAIALVAIPYVIRGLGAERFGVLSIASALLGYFSIFDFGLSRATTKFVAESLAHGEYEKLPKVVWTALWSQFVLGAFGTLLTMALIPLTVDRFLRISPALVAETRASLFLLSTSLCIMLAGNALRGVLEAGQMFNVVNYVKVPTNALMFLLPAVGVFFHLRLTGIVWLLVAARISATIAYLVACLRLFPSLRNRYLPDRNWFRPLLAYGGWVTVSAVVTPLLTYTDRFIIGDLLSVNAVAYFTTAYEAVNRGWVIPATLAATVFPAFTNLDAGGSRHRLEELCARSLKSLLLISAPALLVLVLFAKQVLRWWLGAEFANQSAGVLQILALGMLINSVALIPVSLLQGVGRPDLTAAFSLLEFVFQVFSCWLLVRHFGIVGAALAWTLRTFLDALLTFGAVFWINSVSVKGLLQNGMRRALLVVLALAISLAIVWQTHGPFVIQVPVAGLLVLAFVLVSWLHVLDSRDRDLLIVTAAQFRLAFAKSN